MDNIFHILVFIFGTFIGSFLNVVILRYNTGKTIAKGRSRCFSCSKTLKWNHLIPVLSYVFLRGKCSYCKSKISMQYPVIEILTGLSFLFIIQKVAISPMSIFYLVVFSILLVISAYDYRHKIIPDGLVFTFIGLSFLRIVIDYFTMKGDISMDIFSGLFISLFFATLWWISDGSWMGFGDAKLALGIGWLLPFCQNVSAIMLSFFIGSIAGIFLLIFAKIVNYKGKLLHLDHEIPFAPFLILATFMTFAFNFDVIGYMTGNIISCFI